MDHKERNWTAKKHSVCFLRLPRQGMQVQCIILAVFTKRGKESIKIIKKLSSIMKKLQKWEMKWPYREFGTL